jgi:DNA gyrase subunit B
MKATVNRDEKIYYIEFDNEDNYHVPHKGHKVAPLKVIGDIKGEEKQHGTTIEFFPDFTIMEKND